VLTLKRWGWHRARRYSMEDAKVVSVLDASNYLRGLLVLIRRDGKVSDGERDLVLGAGRRLGFNEEFCANAIREILENTFIDDSPPRFSTAGLAMTFIRDGLRVAWADREIHPSEADWLRSVARANSIPLAWFERELEMAGKPEKRD
jgi:hypothetical protein